MALIVCAIVALGATFYRVRQANVDSPSSAPSLPSRAAWLSAFPGEEAEVLAKARRFELLSLDPESEGCEAKNCFHGYEVLGRTVVTPLMKRQLLQALAESTLIIEKDETLARCFNPRHGIRALRGKQHVDAVLCFECGQMKTYGPAGQSQAVLTRRNIEVFNDALRAAHIKIAAG